MATLKTDTLTPMQLGRLNAALDKLYRFDGKVCALRDHLATLQGVKKEGDGMINWDRRKYNRMDGKAQRAYEERLKAARFYYVDGWQVPKIVYDAVTS